MTTPCNDRSDLLASSKYFSGSLADRLRYAAEHPVKGRKLDHDLMIEAANALSGINRIADLASPPEPSQAD